MDYYHHLSHLFVCLCARPMIKDYNCSCTNNLQIDVSNACWDTTEVDWKSVTLTYLFNDIIGHHIQQCEYSNQMAILDHEVQFPDENILYGIACEWHWSTFKVIGHQLKAWISVSGFLSFRIIKIPHNIFDGFFDYDLFWRLHIAFLNFKFIFLYINSSTNQPPPSKLIDLG